MRVLVVVPSYNEEAALGAVLDELRAAAGALDGVALEVAVVDDGSRDGTARVAGAAGARVLRLCDNLGIGGAVQTGLRLAAREAFDCAIQLDGDGQHPPREIARLLERFRAGPAVDLVVGTRYQGPAGYRSTPLRRLGSGWLRLLLRAAAGLRTTDPTSGYRLFGPRALALFAGAYPYDYPEPESLVIARAAGLTLAEAAVEMRPRTSGRSSIFGLDAVYYMLKVTLAVVLACARHRGRGPRTDGA